MTGSRVLYDQFLAEWPPERVRSMTVDGYTSAGSKDTVTYWIDFKPEEP